MSTLFFILVVIGVTLNAYVTGVLLHSSFYDTKQKWFQAGIVWFLPVIGAILVWMLARDASTRVFPSNFGIGNGFDDGDLRLDHYSLSDDGCGESVGGGDGGGGGE